jgi:formate hydrogenlyase transcriptional activator
MNKQIDELERIGKALEERLRFERLLSDFSARFVKISPEQVDGEIARALKMILDFFQVDRCFLIRTLQERTAWQVTHAAYAEDQLPPVPVGAVLSRAIHPWAYEMLIDKKQVLAITNTAVVGPPEAEVDRQTWIEWGTRSTLLIPIHTAELDDYVISINSVRNERGWPEEFIPRVRLLGEIFVNAMERRNAEQALRESEARLDLAAASAEARIWELDLDNEVIWTTDKGREFYGLAPGEELTVTGFRSRVHPDDRERLRESVEKARSGEDFNIEYRIEDAPGNFRWIASRGRLSVDGSGKKHRIMGVSIDITERKAKEALLWEQFEEIERLKLQLEKENIVLREELKREMGFEKIIGSSETLKYVFFRVGQVAPTEATVLILGETGTGKGMVANAIHSLSVRKDRPMITVNCAALPANLIESELFGREKGAFTGAHTRQPGRFEVADGGTIFLDEIGELPVELQSKLLRVLQDGEFERLGSAKTVKVNVRVITSTSRDLKEEIRAGRFREDLFYRLNVFPVSIPPLRERADDIPELVRFFVDKYSRKIGRQIDSIPKAAMKALEEYHWPGNVRELEHVIERAVITTSGPVLQLADRLEPVRLAGTADPFQKELAAMEREHILRVLSDTGWRIEGQKGAAMILNLNPNTLRSRMKKLGIKRP